jgi:hypothetical protein
MTAPVVFLSFNRPEHTRRMLDRIRAARPRQLLLLADGPRPDRPEDDSRCAAVREELERVDWPCEVRRRYNSANRGMDAATVLGLDWAFGNVEEAIFLEDDTLPHPDFFPYCTELLERYRDHPNVWQIAGLSPGAGSHVFGGDSYGFAPFGSTWGWATWRHAWRAHRARFPRDEAGKLIPERTPIAFDKHRLLTRGGRRYFSDVANDRTSAAFAWDSYWSLTVIAEGGLAVTPARNLIENTGFGEEATNTREAHRQPTVTPLAWPLSHPAKIEVNPELQRLAERIVARHSGRAVRYAARRIASPRVRRALRAGATVWRHAATGRRVKT